MLAGLASSLKSWAALSLCVSVAHGLPWLGRFNCSQGKVSYFDWETNEARLYRRVHLLCQGFGLKRWPEKLDVCSPPNDQLESDTFKQRMQKLAERRRLIVIDSLRAAAPSLIENESNVAVPLYTLGAIAGSTGCTFLVIHHTKKMGNHKSADLRESIRGSTAILAAIDAGLVISKKKDRFRVDTVKAREEKASEPFALELDDSVGISVIAKDWGQDSSGREADELVEAKLTHAIRKYPGESQNAIIKRVGGNAGALRRAMSKLAAERSIEDRQRGKGSPQWFVVEDDDVRQDKARAARKKKGDQ